MAVKRLRIFAGPNGSGKSTILKSILINRKIDLGIYVNADDIEVILNQFQKLNFSDFKLSVNETVLKSFFKKSEFSPVKRNEFDLFEKLQIEDNFLVCQTNIDSYIAAELAEFIRQQLLQNSISFTFETVMSHSSKIEFLKKAKSLGYKIYLYYVATEDPEINVSRVNVRVELNGHPVSPEKIINRYFKSLHLLMSAVKISDQAYLWDNSQAKAIFLANIEDGTKLIFNDQIEYLPHWFVDSLLSNKTT